MVKAKAAKKDASNINSKLQLVMKSGEFARLGALAA